MLKFRTISHKKILILALNYIGTVQGPYGHSEEGFYYTPEKRTIPKPNNANSHHQEGLALAEALGL